MAFAHALVILLWQRCRNRNLIRMSCHDTCLRMRSSYDFTRLLKRHATLAVQLLKRYPTSIQVLPIREANQRAIAQLTGPLCRFAAANDISYTMKRTRTNAGHDYCIQLLADAQCFSARITDANAWPPRLRLEIRASQLPNAEGIDISPSINEVELVPRLR
jgi:hypothetical protein